MNKVDTYIEKQDLGIFLIVSALDMYLKIDESLLKELIFESIALDKKKVSET